MPEQPRLSIIVTITDGPPNVGRCLEALAAQRDMPAHEIIVPVHPGMDDVEGLRSAHPAVRFVNVSGMPFAFKPDDPGLRHLVYDHRRSAGLHAAQGDIIAMTEDHAIPPPHWGSRIWELHARMPHAAIGGAIDHAGSSIRSWAAYFGEFILYQNPVTDGPSACVSDVNVSYKRAALEKILPVWKNYYHETSVHAALLAAGETLWLSPEPFILHEKSPRTFPAMCSERIAWARIFAGRRAQTVGIANRVLLAFGTALLPLLFLVRRWTKVLRAGRSRVALLTATPLLMVLFSFWAYGEFLGYVTARATADPADGSARATANPQPHVEPL